MAKKDLIICAGEGQSLLKCTGGKVESDFYPSFNMWGNGHTKYCKKCLDKIYDYYYYLYTLYRILIYKFHFQTFQNTLHLDMHF